MPTYELRFCGRRAEAQERDVFECADDEDAVDLARIRFNLSPDSLEADLLRNGRVIVHFQSDRPTSAPRDPRDPIPPSRQPHIARDGASRF